MSFYLNQLRSKCPVVSPSGEKDVFILCPLPNHHEKTPSCRVSIESGVWYCFGKCKRGGHWNELAKALHLTKISRQDIEDGKNAFRELSTQLERVGYEMPNKMPPTEPWTGSWNGMGGNFLRNYGAAFYYDSHNKDNKGNPDPCERIIFPVTIHNELKGWTARRLDDEDGVRKSRPWRNAYGTWVKNALFPYDNVQLVNNGLVLVEGPGDALRFLYYNIPALAIMGTGNWSDMCLSLVISKFPERVVCCFDGDDAGRGLTKEVLPRLQNEFGHENVIDAILPEGRDPGNVSPSWIKQLKEAFFS